MIWFFRYAGTLQNIYGENDLNQGLTNKRMYGLYSRLLKDSNRIRGDRHRKVLSLTGTSGILTMRD